MVTREPEYVVGLDLDGVVADFYSRMREIAADWQGVPVHSLTEEVSYGLPEWGLVDGEYKRLHRYAVTQRRLFASMPAIEGAPQAIRRLSAEKVRLRIITHRLYLEYSHEVSVAQAVQWLEAGSRHSVLGPLPDAGQGAGGRRCLRRGLAGEH